MKLLLKTNDCSSYSLGYSIHTLSPSIKRIYYLSDFKNFFFSRIPYLSRLFRAEITRLYPDRKGIQLCIAKKGIFLKEKDSKVFNKVFSIPRGSRPLNLCFAPSGAIYFGEYFANMDKEEVHIYGSKDGGYTWNVVYTFPEGNINHVHGLFYDKYTSKIWFCTGDRENECIIGYTEDEFKTINEVFRGDQEYRTCNLFFYPEYIVFGTDSQYIQNQIKKFDRKTLEIVPLQDIQGTAIKGGQVGDVSFLSTTVEPSEVNKDMYSHLWVSKDGINWEEKYKAKKDWLPAIFQFGSIEFPEYDVGDENLNELYFSGRALRKIGGKSLKIKI